MNDRCATTTSIGVFVLGGMSERERLATQAHLDGCPICRAEERLLTPVAHQLRVLDAERAAALDDEIWNPPAHLRSSVLATVERIERRETLRRRWLLGAIAAALAAILAVGTGAALRARSQREPGDRLALVAGPGAKGMPAKGWVELGTGETGTYVTFHSRGLFAGKVYRMWFEQPDGKRVPIGSFMSTGGNWVASVGGSGLKRNELVAVGASDENGETVLRADFGASELR